ncbi:hypothetical protein JCM11251_002558 [Rhodosporidiobolus azoricus]
MSSASSVSPANGTASASTSTGSGSGLPCFNGCGREANPKMSCPICLKNGNTDAQFCGQDCFRDNYKSHHQKFHVKADTTGYQFPPGTHDPFANHSKHKYTGPLRAVYPDVKVPRREVPDHIEKPDYAISVQGFSMSEYMARKREKEGKRLNAQEIEGMRKACKLAREVLDIAAAAIRPGITTLEIDEIVHAEAIKRNSYPSPLNYHKFPRSVCTSINEVICHGIPDARPLEDGDIVNLDVTIYHGGFHADLNGTYPVGPSVSAENLSLITCARECLDESIRACRPGFAYQDVGAIIENVCKKYGFSTNRTFVGHGINQEFHPLPDVPHYAHNKAPGRMQVGQTFTIEPMICVGNQKDVHWPDNWTAATVDGKPSAQFEETLLITPDGVEVLTAAPGWRLPEKQGATSFGLTRAPASEGAATGAGASKNKKKKKATKRAKTGHEEEGAKGDEGAEPAAPTAEASMQE